MNKIKNKIHKIFSTVSNKFSQGKINEDDYYKNMFIDNPSWNKPEPNSEEVLRWNIIKDFINIIKKDYENKTIEILDLGSGRGWLTNLLSDYGNVLGIEPVKPVVEYAKKMFPNINFICGKTNDLLRNKNHNKYDVIVTSEVIEHILDKDKEQFIKDINKLLNKNGFLIITTPRKELQVEWMSYLSPDQPIEDWILEKDLEKIVIQNSFTKIKLDRFSIKPIPSAPEIEIYQLWLFKKNND